MATYGMIGKYKKLLETLNIFNAARNESVLPIACQVRSWMISLVGGVELSDGQVKKGKEEKVETQAYETLSVRTSAPGGVMTRENNEGSMSLALCRG